MAPPDGGGAGASRWLLRELAGAAVAATVCLVIVGVALRLWSWHPSVPLSYSSDALYYTGVVKGTIDNGWYLHNPDLGAPFGLESHDFPVVSNDSLQLVIVKVLGLFTNRPFLVANAFYLLTFALNAVGAYAALRFRRVPRPLAVLGGIAFGILPLHFMKGMDYLFFVSAYMVPIGCALVLTVLADEPLLQRRPGAALWGWATRRTAVVVVLSAAIASASVYYAVFTSILLATAAVTRGVVSRSRSTLGHGLVAVAAIGTFVALNQLPTILYRLQRGPNPLVAARDPAETEFYGLKLIQLLLPVPGHRLEPLADFTDRYLSTSKVLGEASVSIGLLAAVGLIWLLVVALCSLVAPGRSPGTTEERNAAFCVTVALLWATTGGLSAIVSYTVSPQLRAWGRMSVFLAFFGLFGTMSLLARIPRRLPEAAGRPALAVAAAVLVVVAAADQTSPRYTPDHAAIERQYGADADFVRQVEDRLPPGSAVLQLPYVAYPEVPPTFRLGVYDELRPYLHSTRLRWSFAAMKGRPEDWHAALVDAPLRSLLAGAAAAGFGGVVVDRFGFVDGAAGLVAELTAILGPVAVEGATERLLFWDLRTVADRLRAADQSLPFLADQALRPLRLSWGDGFSAEEAQPGLRWRWMEETGSVIVDNPAAGARDAIFSVSIRAARPTAGTTTLHLPDGTTETVADLGPEGAEVRRTVRVPPGRSTLRVESSFDAVVEPSGARRRLVAQLVDPALVPVELCEAATVLGGPQGEGGCFETSRAHRP